MTWPVERGDWSVVIMNADGSPGVSAGVSVGAKLGLMLWIGVGLVAVGAILAAVGGAAILVARGGGGRSGKGRTGLHQTARS